MIYLWHERIATLQRTVQEADPDDEFHFDDGYASHLQAVAILEEYGRHGTFFLVSRWVGLPGFLSWDNARRLAAAGHVLGNHTASHVWLGKVPWQARLQEIQDAQGAIWSETDVIPEVFAYPYGLIDKGAAMAVATFDFKVERGISEVSARK